MKVFEHLSIFILQEIDMLMRGLIIIVETANIGLFFVFHYFFAQDLELKIHKMQLLLEIFDVLVCYRVVWILKLKFVFHILTSEVHFNSRFVTCRITKLSCFL